jgi:hypothetical protein
MANNSSNPTILLAEWRKWELKWGVIELIAGSIALYLISLWLGDAFVIPGLSVTGIGRCTEYAPELRADLIWMPLPADTATIGRHFWEGKGDGPACLAFPFFPRRWKTRRSGVVAFFSRPDWLAVRSKAIPHSQLFHLVY